VGVVLGARSFETAAPLLIVGAGACGCIAALAANERGVEALILERDAAPRGNTSLSGGQIPAAGTKLQRAAGLLDDTPELLYRDILAKAHGECDRELARVVAYGSAATIEWLVERYQLPLSCVLDFQYPGHSRPHMHASPSRFGAELLTALVAAVEAEGIPIATSARVTDLFADAEGRVLGVRVARPDGKTEEIGCRALVLACNGFGGNKAMLKKHIPEAANLFYEGHAGNQGDAVSWGEALGASIKDMGSFQGHGAVCTPHGMHLGWATFTEGGFQVNRDGRRFSNENAGYSEQALKVERQPGAVAWAIWDARCEAIAVRQHSHALANEAGAIRRYESIEAMARAIGCDAAVLRNTVLAVEAIVKGKKEDPFGRDFGAKPPLEPPYLMAKVMGALTHTQGGLEIDAQGRVLRKDGRPFPNLFAGGGAARGLSGPADWGYLSGSGLLMATTMGRLAGEAAAALIKGKEATIS
jgi:fumarate reductase flavoprotein subunit